MQKIRNRKEDVIDESFEDTRKCVARFGRAKSLGERAIGCPDAGAASVSLIFEAMHEYVCGE